MKVCPKCGYEDWGGWKHSRHGWERQMDYAHLHELKEHDPALAAKLEENHEYDDGLYFYKLSKKGTVYRLLSRDGKQAYNQHGFAEHPKPVEKTNPQVKLDVSA